jgi:hypothetical protein
MAYNVAFDFLENASELLIEQTWKRMMKRTGYSIGLYDEVENPSNDSSSMEWQGSNVSEKEMDSTTNTIQSEEVSISDIKKREKRGRIHFDNLFPVF